MHHQTDMVFLDLVRGVLQTRHAVPASSQMVYGTFDYRRPGLSVDVS